MKQKGFTLIELIVVIMILGILAATALPKVIGLSSDARGAVMKGVMASMQGANTMLYGKAVAQNQAGSTGTLTIGGNTINLVYGYAKNTNDLKNVIDLTPSGDFTFAADGSAISHKQATTPASCQVGYVAPTAAGGVPTYTLKVDGSNSGDCS